MAYYVKCLGSAENPYSQERHLREDHSVVAFPSQSARVKPGDTMFLYAVGHSKFFGIVTFLNWSDRKPLLPNYPLVADVFINALIRDLELAPLSDDLFPLPGGTDSSSLRRHSHVEITRQDAKVLASAILKTVRKEVAAADFDPADIVEQN